MTTDPAKPAAPDRLDDSTSPGARRTERSATNATSDEASRSQPASDGRPSGAAGAAASNDTLDSTTLSETQGLTPAMEDYLEAILRLSRGAQAEAEAAVWGDAPIEVTRDATNDSSATVTSLATPESAGSLGTPGSGGSPNAVGNRTGDDNDHHTSSDASQDRNNLTLAGDDPASRGRPVENRTSGADKLLSTESRPSSASAGTSDLSPPGGRSSGADESDPSDPGCTISEIADALDNARPSVSKAIKRLKDAGFVSHQRYGRVRLTPLGRRLATEQVRVHGILKHFLRDVLGLPETIAEADTCRMEHAISRVTVDRLVQFVEHLDQHDAPPLPALDPHQETESDDGADPEAHRTWTSRV